ncbi:MAG TPA: hypothetical protein VF484_11400, partial [Candidatus Limnocylindrales bacterium]
SGGLAGLAGASIVLGVLHKMQSSFATSIGFDSIAVALLARSNPWAIIPSALLFGAMRAGANRMQAEQGVPPELINVLVATTLLFVVATPAVRRLLEARRTRRRLAAGPVAGPPAAPAAGPTIAPTSGAGAAPVP